MIILENGDTLQIVLGGSATTDQPEFVASYADEGATPTIGRNIGETNGTTPVTLVAGPASGYHRVVRAVTISNRDTVDVTYTIQITDGVDTRVIHTATAAPGSTEYYDGGKWGNLSRSEITALTLAGHTVTDIAVAGDTPGTSNSKLVTEGFLFEQELGGGSKNYITNGKAEDDTTGWSAYADAAASTPVDGTGGSPTVTLTRTTSAPLSGDGSFLLTKDAANRQGEGASCAFSIDLADVNRQLTISFDWLVASGTYAAGDVAVHVYDVTNSKLVPIASNNSIDANGHAVLQFSTTSSTSYRLIFHIASTSASAWTAKLDNVSVGPVDAAVCFAGSDWVDFTPTITGIPVTGVSAGYRRVGDSAEVSIRFQATGAATGALVVGIAGIGAIDTGKLSSARCIGVATVFDNGAAGPAGAVYWSGSTIQVQGYIPTTTAANTWGNAGPIAWGSGDVGTLTFTVPIVGWSGTQAVQPGHRYRWAERFAATATRVTTTPTALGQYRSYNRTGGSQTGVDTAPSTAPSVASGLFLSDQTSYVAGAAGVVDYEIFIGRNKCPALELYANTGRTGHLNGTKFNASSTFTIGTDLFYDPTTGVARVKTVFQGGETAHWYGTTPGWTGGETAYFDIVVSDDPVPVAQAPAVHVEASSDAGQSVTANVTNWQHEDVTRGAAYYDGTTFTAPVDGVYLVVAKGSVTTAVALGLYALIDGTSAAYGVPGNDASGRGLLCVQLYLSAGQQVTIRSENSVTRNTLPKYNYLSITRVGD